jgi:hypothetical protein
MKQVKKLNKSKKKKPNKKTLKKKKENNLWNKLYKNLKQSSSNNYIEISQKIMTKTKTNVIHRTKKIKGKK